MKIRLLLANYAEVQANLLYAMGIGWTQIGPAPSPFAIAALIEVGWDETNQPYRLAFNIVDVDEQPFLVPTPMGDQPFQLSAELRVGRPPDSVPGAKFLTPVAINVQPLQFQAGRHYVVRATVNGDVRDEVSFRVRQEPVPQQPA
jgi:uncharacterized protein DUF6941